MPDWLWQLDLNIDELDISVNKLSGNIPNTLGFLSASVIDWGSNRFDGPLPLWSSNMTRLYLNDNMFSGPIPHEIGEVMPFLTDLDISRNYLNGSIPLSIGNLNTLIPWLSQIITCQGNPSVLEQLPLLYILDVSNNRESMKSLLILRLRSNFFSRNIPAEICSLSNLHILDLSHNDLQEEFLHLTKEDTDRYEVSPAKGGVLQYGSTLFLVNSIDLSSNSLSGEIPKELTSLVKLGTLNISMNNLTGIISTEIGQLEWLETLDLSRNKLFGLIPPTMAVLTFLSHLDLSYNNLSGKVPTNNQFQTFNYPAIYEGNTALCGVPLPTLCSEDNKENSPMPDVDNEDDDGDDLNKLWFWVSVGLGFTVGFWGFCGTLIIKKSWRFAYFRFINEKKDALLAISSVIVARLLENFKAVTRHQRQM
ncbi:hypothetical protein P3X46_032664 [Hevea brasiliensis]|uniref:Leucine-rich repeat-containing N-terminal plant-type domain-containing protein n=1 Tax=Hevea brasiliensis TaxID=3981 RepID=A0ABQ9KH27_HEVBR|nr:hypothetical protein P3X46_032664 [Hevea brasiliensis]